MRHGSPLPVTVEVTVQDAVRSSGVVDYITTNLRVSPDRAASFVDVLRARPVWHKSQNVVVQLLGWSMVGNADVDVFQVLKTFQSIFFPRSVKGNLQIAIGPHALLL